MAERKAAVQLIILFHLASRTILVVVMLFLQKPLPAFVCHFCCRCLTTEQTEIESLLLPKYKTRKLYPMLNHSHEFPPIGFQISRTTPPLMAANIAELVLLMEDLRGKDRDVFAFALASVMLDVSMWVLAPMAARHCMRHTPALFLCFHGPTSDLVRGLAAIYKYWITYNITNFPVFFPIIYIYLYATLLDWYKICSIILKDLILRETKMDKIWQ